jgi:hypothetical protein
MDQIFPEARGDGHWTPVMRQRRPIRVKEFPRHTALVSAELLGLRIQQLSS